MNNIKSVIGGFLSLVAGAVGIYAYIRYNNKQSNLLSEAKLEKKQVDFEEQKERVMNMIETSRKKFNETHTPPIKNSDKKSNIHSQNHNLKASTKRIN